MWACKCGGGLRVEDSNSNKVIKLAASIDPIQNKRESQYRGRTEDTNLTYLEYSRDSISKWSAGGNGMEKSESKYLIEGRDFYSMP